MEVEVFNFIFLLSSKDKFLSYIVSYSHGTGTSSGARIGVTGGFLKPMLPQSLQPTLETTSCHKGRWALGSPNAIFILFLVLLRGHIKMIVLFCLSSHWEYFTAITSVSNYNAISPQSRFLYTCLLLYDKFRS